MSPVVVHDFVVQVLLVGQVPVGCQVLLVRLLMEVTQLGCRGHGESVGQAARGRCRGPMATQPNPVPGEGHHPLPLHCSRWDTSSAALLSLQGSRPCARSFLIWRVKRYLWRGQERALGGSQAQHWCEHWNEQ